MVIPANVPLELSGGPDDGLFVPPDLVELVIAGDYGESGVFCGLSRPEVSGRPGQYPEYRMRADGTPIADFIGYRKPQV